MYRGSIKKFSAIVLLMFSVTAIGLPTGGPEAVAGETASNKGKPSFDEDGLHHVSVYSFMRPLRGRRDQRSVLVTLTVKGPEALIAFCGNQPFVKDAILNVLWRDPIVSGNRKVSLEEIRRPLLDALNNVLPDSPVRNVKIKIRSGSALSEFGQAMMHTKNSCVAVKG